MGEAEWAGAQQPQGREAEPRSAVLGLGVIRAGGQRLEGRALGGCVLVVLRKMRLPVD